MSQDISKQDLDRWNKFFNDKMAKADQMVKVAMDRAKKLGQKESKDANRTRSIQGRIS